MFFKIFKWLCAAVVIILFGAGWLARTKGPESPLYAYRINIYEPVKYFLTPSSAARDADIANRLRDRLDEVTHAYVTHRIKSDDRLMAAVSAASDWCVARATSAVGNRAWQRAQDLSARCLALFSGFSSAWMDVGQLGRIPDELSAFSLLAETDSSKLLDARAEASKIARVAIEHTDFLAGLEDQAKVCRAKLLEAQSAAAAVNSRMDLNSTRILSADVATAESLSAGASKSIAGGDYREGWWLSSEVCGYAEAVMIRIRYLPDSQYKLSAPLDIQGFSQLK